jgi:hypothetical protein
MPLALPKKLRVRLDYNTRAAANYASLLTSASFLMDLSKDSVISLYGTRSALCANPATFIGVPIQTVAARRCKLKARRSRPRLAIGMMSTA